MGVPRRLDSDVRREWFADARNDGRHMELSWHRDQRLVIVSLWSGSDCRATFQMLIEDVAPLIGALAGSLGEEAVASTSVRPDRSPLPDSSSRRSMLRRLMQRFDRQRAEIVSLRTPRSGR